MKTIREQFEEIWPVPEGVTWCDASGAYWFRVESHEPTRMATDMNLRLDTFTRCQESQAIVTSLNDELVGALEMIVREKVVSADGEFGKIVFAAIAKARGGK